MINICKGFVCQYFNIFWMYTCKMVSASVDQIAKRESQKLQQTNAILSKQMNEK